MITILTLYATLSSDKAHLSKVESRYDTETAKQYRKRNSVFNKADLMFVKTHGTNTLSHISFYVYCLPEDEEKAIETLKAKVLERYDELVKNFERTKSQLELFKSL
jgi:hypothetical protein